MIDIERRIAGIMVSKGITCSHISIGSFYFIFLENSLNRTEGLRPDIAGNLWAIHGGGFYTGGGSLPYYDGANLAKQGDVIIVTINYRLGPLGFLYFENLKGNNPGFESNIGIKDQMAALKWVKENIEHFGGDSANVTIFGQSAGAVSVVTLMNTPSGKNLFHKAIAQSPVYAQCWTKEKATRFTTSFLELLGIRENNLTDIYSYPYDSLVKVADRMIETEDCQITGVETFAPTIDEEFITSFTTESNAVPFLLGTAKNEMNLFIKEPLMPFSASSKYIYKIFASDEKQLADPIIKSYRKYQKKQTILDICTHGVFLMPSISKAENHSIKAPTYFYRFDWSSLPLNLAGYKTCHALDIFFVFNSFETKQGQMVSKFANKKEIKQITQNIQAAWINFAHTGNPNAIGLNKWEVFNASTHATMIFDKKTRLEFDPDKKHRLAWKDIKLY